MINVINNFINNDFFYKVSNTVFNTDEFPWYIKNNYTQEKHLRFKHTLIKKDEREKITSSPFAEILLSDILKQLKAKKINFAEITLRTRTEEIIKLPPKMSPNIDNKTLTAILFLNTNNGHTQVSGQHTIESVENRVIIFPSYSSYFNTTASNKNFRGLITLEYDV